MPPFGMGGGALTKVDPSVGDTVLIDLYYNKTGGGVVATASDLTTGHTQAITIDPGDPGPVHRRRSGHRAAQPGVAAPG